MAYTNCKKCGNHTENRFRGYCENCYNYYRNGGTDNPIPPKGVVTRDKRGYIICHICGMAFKKLGQHAWNKHKLTAKDYKREFELCNNSHLTENTYAEKMSKLAYKYDMPERLKITGKNTRIKPGDRHMRLGKISRLQECLAKRQRRQNEI